MADKVDSESSNGEQAQKKKGAISKVGLLSGQIGEKGTGKFKALRTTIRDTSLKLKINKKGYNIEENTKDKRFQNTKKDQTIGTRNIATESKSKTSHSSERSQSDESKPTKVSKASKLVHKLSIGKYRPGKSKTPSPSEGSPVLTRITTKEKKSNYSTTPITVTDLRGSESEVEDLISSESGDSVSSPHTSSPLSYEKRSQSKKAAEETIKMQVGSSETPPISSDITSETSNKLQKLAPPDESLREQATSSDTVIKESLEETSISSSPLVKSVVTEPKIVEFSYDNSNYKKVKDLDSDLSQVSELLNKNQLSSVTVELCSSNYNTSKDMLSEKSVESPTSNKAVFESEVSGDNSHSEVSARTKRRQNKSLKKYSYPEAEDIGFEQESSSGKTVDSEEEFGDALTKEREQSKSSTNVPASVYSSSNIFGIKTPVAQQGIEKREHLYKILVIGELGTGKTSIIKRYVHQFFSQHYRATIGVDFALKVLNWDANTIIRLQLWDIAGQERFGNMTRVYYKEAVGAFIVFDVTRAATFDAVLKWKQDLDTKVQLPNGSPIPCILLANKCDQQKEGLVNNPEKMDEYCKERGFTAWYETSAKLNVNIEEAAKSLVTNILQNDKLIHENSATRDTEKFSIDGRSDHKATKKSCSC